LPISAYISLKIFDALGREITTLMEGYQKAGSHLVCWDGHDSEEQQVASGIYFYQLQAGEFDNSRIMTLLR